MPNWKDYHKDCPYLFGNPTDDRYLTVSIEPSGLQLFGDVDDTEFEEWFDFFVEKSTNALEYEIGELEAGYEFIYK